MDQDSFERVIVVLNELELRGYVRLYAIAGAVAVIFYTEPFFTEDVDILVTVPEERDKSLTPLQDIYSHLINKGYNAEDVYIRMEGNLVQFLVASDPLFREALEQSIEIPYGSTKTRVLTPEYLLAMMANAGRPKDFLKMNYLLEQKLDIDRNLLNDILRNHNLTEKWARFEKSRQ